MTSFQGLAVPIECPSCGERTINRYVRVWHCTSCGDHGGSYKSPSTPRTKTRREEWRRFSFTDQYVPFQHKAMIVHLRATDAIDKVYFSAHDAFGNPEGAWVMIAK